MGWQKSLSARMLIIALGLATVATTGWWLLQRVLRKPVPSHTYRLDATEMSEWHPIGGNWLAKSGFIYNNSSERGAKLVTGSNAWEDYTLNADLKFEGESADMGIVVRANDEEEGTDTYNGYYVGIRTLDGSMVVGRSEFGWREAKPVPIPGGVDANVWYRLRVTVVGCSLAASTQNLRTLQTAWVAIQEPHCVKSGRIGLRSLNAGGVWRNINIAPATWNDFLALRSHVAEVEHPEVVPGPPWWTPWHTAALLAGLLISALIVQYVYFRTRQWKTYTIMTERERFAHQIHDTMAQSFAGIGYQIQGIQHKMLSGHKVDVQEITSQLGVAYQLVRKCHEEASKTIALYGAQMLSVEGDLLDQLVNCARQIAGPEITITAAMHGTPGRIKPQVADAFLQIGREAIVNAISYSKLTHLTITLTYDHEEVELAVQDNGNGFDPGPESIGFGILGMKKRARNTGATLNIDSTPNIGTTIRVRAPISRGRFGERIVSALRRKLLESAVRQ